MAAQELGLWRTELASAEAVLAVDKEEPKALYRKAFALEKLGRREESKEFLRALGLPDLDKQRCLEEEWSRKSGSAGGEAEPPAPPPGGRSTTIEAIEQLQGTRARRSVPSGEPRMTLERKERAWDLLLVECGMDSIKAVQALFNSDEPFQECTGKF